MRPKHIISSTITGLVLAASQQSSSHHSDSFYFIEDRGADGGQVKIEGTISRHAGLWIGAWRKCKLVS